jgi:hypothetical protein
MTPQLSNVEYWQCGRPWSPHHFVRVAFGERVFYAPYANDAIAPWDHEPTLAEVVGELAELVGLLQAESTS